MESGDCGGLGNGDGEGVAREVLDEDLHGLLRLGRRSAGRGGGDAGDAVGTHDGGLSGSVGSGRGDVELVEVMRCDLV